MLAQEAIERTEVEILRLDEQIRFLKLGLESKNKLKHILEGKEVILFDYESQRNALSIVLTMAKEYHELMISDENMRRVPLTGKDTGDALKQMYKSMEGDESID